MAPTLRCCASLVLWWGLLPGVSLAQASGQPAEWVRFDSPEGWAMAWVGAATTASSFSPLGGLPAGRWELAAELTAIPRLDDRQKQVGFGGLKAEDLDKSPVFGRGLARLGLPGGWLLELGYTPPLRVEGARPSDLWRLGLRYRRPLGERLALMLGAEFQHGAAHADVTCPAAIAASRDPAVNPFGCLSPSRDRIDLRQHGGSLALDMGAPTAVWRWHLGLARLHLHPEVQVRAQLEGGSDRSVLASRGWASAFTIGAGRALGRRSWLALELVHLPLEVRRPQEGRRGDDFTSIRLSLGWRP